MAQPVLIQDTAATQSAAAGTKKTNAKSSADQFLALLNVGGKAGDFSGAEQGEDAGRKKQDALDVLAAPVAGVVAIENTRRAPSPKGDALSGRADVPQNDQKINSASETKPAPEDAARPRNAAPEKKDAPVKAEAPTRNTEQKPESRAEKTSEPKALEEKIAEPAAPSDAQATEQTAGTATAPATALDPASLPLLKAIEGLTQQFLQDYQQLMQQGGDAKAIFSLVQNYQKQLAELVAPALSQQAGQPTLPENIAQSVMELLDSSQLLMRQLADAIAFSEQAAEPLQNPAAQLGKVILPHIQDTQQQLAQMVSDAIRQSEPKAQVLVSVTQVKVMSADALSADAAMKQNALAQQVSAALPAAEAAAPQAVGTQNNAALNPQLPTTTQQNAQATLSAQAVASGARQEPMSGQGGSGFSREGQGQQSQPMVMAAAGAQAARSGEATSSAGSFSRLLSQTPHTPLAEQVSVQVKTLVRDGGNQIRIQLNPHELGRIEIKLNVGSDGKTGVAIIADQRTTMELLQRDTRSLEQALADAGLSMEGGSLSFSFRGDSQQQAQTGDDTRAWPVLKRLAEAAEPEVDLSLLSGGRASETATGLDITI